MRPNKLLMLGFASLSANLHFIYFSRLGREAQQIIPVGLRFAQRQPTFYLAQPTALYFLLSPHFASLHAGYARYIKNFSLDKAYPELALKTFRRIFNRDTDVMVFVSSRLIFH